MGDSDATTAGTGEAELARIFALAEHFLGDANRANDWLGRPNETLGGIAPLDAVKTDAGLCAVENLLGRIGYGGVS